MCQVRRPYLTAGCRKSLTHIAAEAAASNREDVFNGYVSATLNSLLYLLPDCLQRLDGLFRVERARADEAGWQALSKECAFVVSCCKLASSSVLHVLDPDACKC